TTAAKRGDTTVLNADFSYIDRGRRIHLTSAMAVAADYTPRRLEVVRFTNDTARTVAARVDVEGRNATIVRNGQTSTVTLPATAFAISAYQPLSQHVALIKYWRARGKPDSIDVVPGPLRVSVKQLGKDTVEIGELTPFLTRYAIDGLIWGREYV